MFVFDTTDGRELKAYFKYEREDVPANPHKENSKPHKRPVATTCFIVDKDGLVVGVGNAKCHYKDHFSYNVGRKFALKRALRDAGLDRTNRARAWIAFMEGM